MKARFARHKSRKERKGTTKKSKVRIKGNRANMQGRQRVLMRWRTGKRNEREKEKKKELLFLL